MVSKARNAVPAGTIAGRSGGIRRRSQPVLTRCAESAFFAAGDGLSPWRRWRVSGPPRLVSGAPAYPGAELVGSPLALRAAASPQRTVHRILARLRLPRDESRVGGQGSRQATREIHRRPRHIHRFSTEVSRAPGGTSAQ